MKQKPKKNCGSYNSFNGFKARCRAGRYEKAESQYGTKYENQAPGAETLGLIEEY